MTPRRVLLLRHGETEWNAADRWQGHGGEGLSQLGREQAERTAAFLSATRPDVTALVRSDLQRVAETADPIVERFAVPVEVDARWREIDVGTWSGSTHEQVRASDPDAYAAWRRGEDVRRGGGETDAELRARVSDALEELLCGDGTVLVVTHGGPIRHAVAVALGLPADGHARLAGAGNCSLSELVAGDGQWSVGAYNARSHLDAPAGRGGREEGRAVVTRPSPSIVVDAPR